MKITLKRRSLWAIALLSSLFALPVAHAGKTFKHNDTTWISVGAGLRTSFSAIENKANDEWPTRAAIDNFRLYFNAQVHEYLKFEVNTECADCTRGGDFIVLDAIAKFDINDYFNLWVGLMLVPSDRAELDGPFYQNTFEFNKTPFYPSDFGSYDAGKFGRDYGFTIWGALTPDKKLTYSFGVFRGSHENTIPDGPLLYAGRLSYNFLNVEDNPGYYTSSTYYGKAGDILTLAVATQYQEDGAGSAANPADFWGISVDVLSETVLSNEGVLTLEAEYKHFDLDGVVPNDPNRFGLFAGHAYTGTALYLFPEKIGFGQFQPYVRYTYNDPDTSSSRDEVEAGLNYIIDGHNANIFLAYQYGDIATEGRNYAANVNGDNVSAIKLGMQLQY